VRRKITIWAAAVIASASLPLGAVLTANASTSAASRGAHVRAATTCGSWRWPVKTGADRDRHAVSKTVIHTTIRFLRTRTAPSSFPSFFQNHRFRGAERHIYQLKGTRLTAFKLEDDGDIHLILVNNLGKSMIAEIPKPGCVRSASLWRSAIKSARASFMHRYSVTTSWHHVNQRITIRGLGFFDEVHGQDGVAPNGIELHPVISIHFGS
jgi:hypothetical protein